LMSAEEVTGANVEILRLMDLRIKPCNGCDICMMTRVKTGVMGDCAIKDDHMPFLIRKFVDCDGLILSTPTYFARPPGFLMMLRDRMLGIGGEYFRKAASEPKVAATIVIGGSDNVGLALPMAKQCLPFLVRFIDQMMVIWTSEPGQVVLNEEAIARAGELGRNVGEAMLAPRDRVTYRGAPVEQTYDDSEPAPKLAPAYEVCPECHSDLLRVRGDFVECPFCYTRGTIKTIDGKISFMPYGKELQVPHFGPVGVKRHDEGLQRNQELVKSKKEAVKEKLVKYKNYKSCLVPPPLHRG
jgi:multimeric flavodoxin WrbA